MICTVTEHLVGSSADERCTRLATHRLVTETREGFLCGRHVKILRHGYEPGQILRLGAVHWAPGVPFSYPSGGARRPNFRTFVFGGPVCRPRSDEPVSTSRKEDVTCKRCLSLIEVGRFDTDATVSEVLGRGDR